MSGAGKPWARAVRPVRRELGKLTAELNLNPFTEPGVVLRRDNHSAGSFTLTIEELDSIETAIAQVHLELSKRGHEERTRHERIELSTSRRQKRFGDVEFDRAAQEVRSGHVVVHLHRQRLALFEALWEASGRIMERERLHSLVYWDLPRDERPGEGAIGDLVRDLRRDLDPLPLEIEMIYGVGYRLNPRLPLERPFDPNHPVATARADE